MLVYKFSNLDEETKAELQSYFIKNVVNATISILVFVAFTTLTGLTGNQAIIELRQYTNIM